MNSTHFSYSSYVVTVTEIIEFFLTFTFLVLASLVLMYYIRRRYNLYKEIREITLEQLWQPSYKNHLKNLKIKSMITNFIIIILIIEIANNSAEFITAINYLISHKFYGLIFHFVFISQSFYVPILCLLLKVLWLAYLHSPYKYTILRWIAYIVLRLAALYVVYSWQFVYVDPSVRIEISLSIFTYAQSVFHITDLITYLVYSRRFYLHLKSRRLESKLFDSEEKYRENYYLCVHFKIATIIVATALFLYTFSGITFCLFILSVNISKFLVELFTFTQWRDYLQALLILRYVALAVYRVLLNLDYLYVFSVIVFKYCRQKSNLYRVNDRIKPLVRDYQYQLYSRRDSVVC